MRKREAPTREKRRKEGWNHLDFTTISLMSTKFGQPSNRFS
jgi:hypothetical protein